MGDGVMALWGAVKPARMTRNRPFGPIADAGRPGRFSSGPKAWASGLKMRIGLNTGPVLLGSIGTRGEVTAIGDTVNVASRLEQICPAGGVLISHDTYRHVRGVFEVEVAPRLKSKANRNPSKPTW
jgi:class 3 adenylate cyclase